MDKKELEQLLSVVAMAGAANFDDTEYITASIDANDGNEICLESSGLLGRVLLKKKAGVWHWHFERSR